MNLPLSRVAAWTIAVVLAVALLVAAAVGLAWKSVQPEVTQSLGLTDVYVRNLSDTAFVVRFVSAGAEPPLALFVLPGRAEGGALTTLEPWSGRLEILDGACAVQGASGVSGGDRIYVDVNALGTPVRVPSFLDDSSSLRLASTGDCLP